jgi:GntR family transcriptional regulator, transcriptional repressor for pyruvate dehydrogenase complex
MQQGSVEKSSGWTPVPQVVARQLQEKILSGEWAEGDLIPSQRALSEAYGISRASLREALLTLETLGLIRTEPGRGTFVSAAAPVSEPPEASWRYSDSFALQDVFETRVMLEGKIAELAARSITPEDIQMLRAATEEMERCWARGDLLTNVEADLRFHRTIASSCHNPMLMRLYDTVADLLTETQRQPIPRTRTERMLASLSEHRAIIEGMEKRDSTLARAAMEAHIRNTADCAGIVI